ncbi:Protein kinase family protein [Euphorbia peplus]|nr:Protein kinase family protein [Euphorbia peplus]
MEQFRQIGEVLGSLKALMILQDDIRINQRQCCLLLNIFTSAFDIIAEEIKLNLKLEERTVKWKPLEEPLRELCRIFKEGELYIRRCLDSRDWWGKVVSLHQNRDSIEFHVHNLLTCFPAVIEAIEYVSEISGLDQEEMQKKRVMLARKYDRSWNDPKLFQWRFGKQYLVSNEIISQVESAIKEDGWLLAGTIQEKIKSESVAKTEQRLGDIFIKKLNRQKLVNGKLPPSSILLGAEDYQVRRRLDAGGQYKEIQWLGESFALRHFYEDIKPLSSEIATMLSLSHPNIVQYLCGFNDEDKKECFLIMELMNKDLLTYMKENSSTRRQVLFPLPVVVDIMLQVARGMEYLHSQKIYFGDLNPANVFLKPRKTTEGYFHVKVSGFGLSSIENPSSRYHSSQEQNASIPCIWHAPEVLAEQELTSKTSTCKYSEKADIYSFGMICSGLLTGKLPFEDGHLQGDQMTKNIRAGERPLFPSLSPKYLVNLTKKCWHNNPNYRPSFSSICRVLRYIKKFLVMDPIEGQLVMQSPPVDCSDLEAGFLKSHPMEKNTVSQVPFQMFVYRLAERERISSSFRSKQPEATNGGTSVISWDENISVMEDPITFGSVSPDIKPGSVSPDIKPVCYDIKSNGTEESDRKMPFWSAQTETQDKKIVQKKKSVIFRSRKNPVNTRSRTPGKTAVWNPSGHSAKVGRETITFKIS